MCLLLPLTVFLAVIYFAVAVLGKFRFGGRFVAILEEKVGNVAFLGEATCALGVEFGVIPLEVYARIFFPLRSSVMV